MATAEYADALEERAAAIFDAAVAQDLWRRLGTVAETELKDDRRAISAYAKAGEQAGDDAEILAALDRLYERTKDYRGARRHARATGRPPQSTPSSRPSCSTAWPSSQIDEFEERSQGLATLKQALEHDPDHGASREALEELTERRHPLRGGGRGARGGLPRPK